MRVILVSKAMLTRAYLSKARAMVEIDPELELTVVVPETWSEPRVGLVKLEDARPEGYRLIVLPLRLNGHHHLFSFKGLSRVIETVRPQLLHIDEEPFNLSTFLAARAGQWVADKMLFFTWANIRKRIPPPFSWFRKSVYRWCSGAIAGNLDAAAILNETGFRGTVAVIPQFGVDMTLFPYRKRRFAPPFRVGYMGRLVPEKGVDLLLRAAAAVPMPLELVIVGSGEAEPSLRALAQKLGLEERVNFLKPVGSEAVGKLMGEFHVLVLPSRTTRRWKEQFGRVLAEAMATGCVVIGSDCGEIPRVIGDAGLVFPEGDVEALSQSLESVLSSESLYYELSAKARSRAQQFYSQEAVAAKHVEFYRILLAMSGSRGMDAYASSRPYTDPPLAEDL